MSYLRCFKGINTLAAVTLMVEVQEFRRFHKAPSFMDFTGLTSSEYSSGGKKRQGGISKSGNTHLRRILVECSWSQRYPAKPSKAIKDRREGCPQEVIHLAQRAERRLNQKYRKLLGKGKPQGKIICAVARELAGFVWAMAHHFPVSLTA